ncbi:hypothetical protein AB1N83_013861 [Pleurotus pulmonarius]
MLMWDIIYPPEYCCRGLLKLYVKSNGSSIPPCILPSMYDMCLGPPVVWILSSLLSKLKNTRNDRFIDT